MLRVDAIPNLKSARAGDILHSLADISEARDALGFTARMEFDEGIALILGDQAATIAIAVA